jgi:hypothetical protein
MKIKRHLCDDAVDLSGQLRFINQLFLYPAEDGILKVALDRKLFKHAHKPIVRLHPNPEISLKGSHIISELFLIPLLLVLPQKLLIGYKMGRHTLREFQPSGVPLVGFDEGLLVCEYE